MKGKIAAQRKKPLQVRICLNFTTHCLRFWLILVTNSIINIISFAEAEKQTILNATYQAMQHETRAKSKRVLELQKEVQNLLGDIKTPVKKKPKKKK